MRFIENGPSIPDALLHARDEGRVVFFCGAGVSRAKAELPDFFGLANDVLTELGATADCEARKLLDLASEISNTSGVPGLISADRVFGLLEREFAVDDIQVAVARCLAAKMKKDPSAHQILLRLATTPASKTQLVTTNFDRLFEMCDRKLLVHQPPRLPKPSRDGDLNGLVYLHGRVNDDYSRADENCLILSSSDFGHAYLSEGWATEFFRDIVRRYVVVFVGYSADDPPIQYLLEGLRRTQDSRRQLYAFQSGESDSALARWRDKGVEVIPYAEADGHRALWETLEKWAVRADNPVSWSREIVALAMIGPQGLRPHQRGQVAHLVTTYDGARDFAEHLPPAEWLCVFDPECRYASPGRSRWFDLEAEMIDPFALYGLDSDSQPERGNPENQFFAARDAPSDAWDAFAISDFDRQNLSTENFPSVRGPGATTVARLPKRLKCVGNWIAKVANDPAAVWWAARQQSLHPEIRHGIEWQIQRRHSEIKPVVREAWRYLLKAREQRIETQSSRDRSDLRRQIGREGWSAAAIRQFIANTRPYLTVGPAMMAAPCPPRMDTSLRASDLVSPRVECPLPAHDITIPDEVLEKVIRGLRKNIELASQLCDDVDDPQRLHISPIAPDNRPDRTGYERNHGLSGLVVQFASLFDRLVINGVRKAQREMAAWPTDDDFVFARLRLWAGGKASVVKPHEFCDIVMGLGDEAFWNHDHQRDLLLVLAARWESIATKSRKRIEHRLLQGPVQWDGEDGGSYKNRNARATMDRLQWLANHGCEFSFDVQVEIAQRRQAAPEWKPEGAEHAADSRELRGGHFATTTEHSVLLREPIGSILSKALELSGRSESDTRVQRDPFSGLCAERPARAYRALARAARGGDYPEWAWRTFLGSEGRDNDKPKMTTSIAECLCRMPDESLLQNLHVSTRWLQKIGTRLSLSAPGSFDKIVSRQIDLLREPPSEGSEAGVGRARNRDWATEALDSPAGHIALAILEDSRADAVDGDGAPATLQLGQLERLLELPGDPRRHTIAIITRDLEWFYRRDPQWTESQVLSIIDAEDPEDQQAFWAGFLWNAEIPSAEFYLRLKPAMLALAKGRSSSRKGHLQELANLAVSGWITVDSAGKNPWITNAEFREVLIDAGDELRSHVLWQIERGLSDEDSSVRKQWAVNARDFFHHVWPRQKVAKSPEMSVRLCELLLSSGDDFAELADIVVPLLTRITAGTGLRSHFLDESSVIIDRNAERLLRLLHVVLPYDVAEWPYGIGDVLDRIGEADRDLLSDARLVELRRRWSSR